MAKDSTVRGIWGIEGIEVNAPMEHMQTQITAQFDRSAVQATVEFESLTFTGKAAGIIIKRVRDAKNGIGFGIYQGMPITLRLEDKNSSLGVFDGYIDLTDEYFEVNPGEVRVKVKKRNNIFTLRKKMEAVDYAFLLDRNDVPGSITPSDWFDFPYVVEKKNNPIELTLMGVAIFLMVKELAQAVQTLALNIANVITIAAGGFPVTGQIASLALALAQAIIQAIYVAILAVAVIKMLKTFIANFISPVRRHKTILYRTLLERGAEYFGLGFSSDIKELDFLHYLASKPTETEAIKEGIPRQDDFGHTVREAFEYIEDKTESTMAIINGVLHLRPKDDPFWKRRSSLTIKSTLQISEQNRNNASELNSSVFISFKPDVSNSWTSDNLEGTFFQVITSPKNVDEQDLITLDGLDSRDSPFGLVNRKDELNIVEKTLLSLVKTADALVKFFGEDNSLTQEIIKKLKGRVGMGKFSQNNHSIPYLVPIKNGLVPLNHRDIWSAKVLWNNYLKQVSFVRNAFKAQKQLLRGEEIPFGYPSFLKMIDNKFFDDIDGREAEAIKLEWTFNESIAVIDADIDEIHDRNLQETEIEGK